MRVTGQAGIVVGQLSVTGLQEMYNMVRKLTKTPLADLLVPNLLPEEKVLFEAAIKRYNELILKESVKDG